MILFSDVGKQMLVQALPHYEFYFSSCLDSTQSECYRKWQQEPDKCWAVLSDRQTQGRGRYGHNWVSHPAANIYLSFVQKNVFGHRLGHLNLCYGIFLYKTIVALYPDLKENLTLKWPNDLYFFDKKIAGLLFQTLDADLSNIIVGIGINVYARTEQLPAIGSSLVLESGRKNNQQRFDIVKYLLSKLETNELRAYSNDPEKLQQEFQQFSCRTRSHNYNYSSHHYSYQGFLEKLYPDATVDIRTVQGEKIHLAS